MNLYKVSSNVAGKIFEKCGGGKFALALIIIRVNTNRIRSPALERVTGYGVRVSLMMLLY